MTIDANDAAGNPGPLPPAERERLILAHLDVVRYAAWRWYAPLMRTSWADDLLGVGRLALVEAASTFREGRSSFKTWAITYVRYRMLDEANRLKGAPLQFSQLDPADHDLDPAARPDDPGARLDLGEALAALPDRDGAMVRARADGLTLAEVGAAAGVSLQRVGQILRRAGGRLRRRLAPAGYHLPEGR